MIRLVTQYADAMACELEENSGKSGWWNLTVRQCLQRAEQEMGELRRAVERGASMGDICSEAADVGNFLAMLVWRAREDAQAANDFQDMDQ